MKTTLYAGQNAVDVCRCFDSVQEVREWLASREKARQQSEQESEQMQRLDGCVGFNGGLVGQDGLKSCTPGPAKNAIRLPASKSVVGQEANRRVCDNHLKGFLLRGWVWISSKADAGPAAVCQLCCTNAVAMDGLCEACLEEATKPASEAERLKNAAYCLNRELVHGCLVWSEVGTQYCTFCRVRELNTQEKVAKEPKKTPMEKASGARIRTIPTSSRACRLTNGCAGTMTAALRRFRLDQAAEMWWTCAICRISRVAEVTKAIPDPRVTQVQLEASEEDALNEPSNTDANEAYMHMRDILNEGAE